ncbi:hypothetical protein MTO96_003068 [Rhipicephalus appendiculatus]
MMAHVDAMSRSPCDPPDETEVVGGLQVLASCIEIDDCLAIAQQNDPDIHILKERLSRRQHLSNEDRRVQSEYQLNNGKLFKKVPAGKRPGKLHSIDKVGKPFHSIHIDHLGPFLRSKSGNAYILVAVDGFTKFLLLRAVRNTSARPAAQFLRDVDSIFGPPTMVITDHGKKCLHERQIQGNMWRLQHPAREKCLCDATS